MSDVFTDFVRCLAAGGEPDRSSCDEVWEHLRALLVTEMRRRSLWSAPPDYLGVTAASWREPGALDELVAGVYEFIFIRRLERMSHQLEIRDNLYGLVVLNVRHFLSERQRKADPIGYRVFWRLRMAIRHLIDKGRLILRGWKAKAGPESEDAERPPIDNASILSFDPFPSPLVDISAMLELATRWNDDLMPELITAEGSAVTGVVQDLADRVSSLPDTGIRAFRFGHLAKLLKDDARGRWRAIWEQLRDTLPEDGEPGAARVPIAQPDETSDWRQMQAVVLACLEGAIGAVTKAKWQRDLWTVWLFVRSTRVDTAEPKDMPSYSETGRELGLPRERVSQILDQLKQWARRCFACDGLCPTATSSNPVPSNDDSAPVARPARSDRNTR